MHFNARVDSDVSGILSATMNRIINPQGHLVHDFSMQDARMARDLNSKLTAFATTRIQYYKTLRQFRRNWVTEGVYDTINNDVLLDNTSDDTVSVEIVGNDALTQEANDLFRKLKIVEILHSIIDDLLHYGSYALRPIAYKGVGVVDLVDDYEPHQVIALTDSKNNPVMFFISDDYLSSDYSQADAAGTYAYVPQTKKPISQRYRSIDELIYFGLDLSFTKIHIEEDWTQAIRKAAPMSAFRATLPKTFKLRASRSFIFNNLDKLQDILLMDKLNTYRSIGDTLTPNVLGVPLPDNYDPQQSTEVTKHYDALLNNNIDQMTDFLDPETMFRELARIRVVPIVGDRSQPVKLETKETERVEDIESKNQALRNFLDSIGVPAAVFFGEAEHKESLKNSIRYAKKIKRIQKNISRALIRLLIIHFQNRYPELAGKLSESDIRVTLRNNTNLDELEDLESQDLTLSSINSALEMFETIRPLTEGEESEYKIDDNMILQVIKDRLGTSGSIFARALTKIEDESITPETSEISPSKDTPGANYKAIKRAIGISEGQKPKRKRWFSRLFNS
nr:MAG TPA: portal [Bacteriophage sp.]